MEHSEHITPTSHPHMFRVVPEYPGYCIAANGDVWSAPKIRVGSKETGYLKMRFQYAGKLADKPFVELSRDGKQGKRMAVLELLKRTYPEIFPEFMKRYGYV